MTSSTPSSCCKGTGGCGSSTSGAGSGCAAAAAADIDEPSSPMDSSKSPKTCARCPNPSDVSTSSFGSAALCSSCLREALRSRVGREAVDLRIKGQRVVVAWSGGGNWTRLVYFFRPAEFEKKKNSTPSTKPLSLHPLRPVLPPPRRAAVCRRGTGQLPGGEAQLRARRGCQGRLPRVEEASLESSLCRRGTRRRLSVGLHQTRCRRRRCCLARTDRRPDLARSRRGRDRGPSAPRALALLPRGNGERRRR